MTALEICNLALGHLGANRITALGVRASGFVQVGAEVAEDTATIAGSIFTLKADAAEISTYVQIGATSGETARSLMEEVNQSAAGASVEADSSTQVQYGYIPGIRVYITARAPGTAGNAITLAEAGSSFTVSGATLTGGTANDGSTEAILLDTIYPKCRDALLMARPWSFALEQFGLTLLSDADPLWQYTHRLYLPPRLLQIVELDGNPEWKQIGRYVYLDDDVADANAVARVEPDRFSAPFIEALALKVAADLCVPLTENRALALELEQRARLALRQAASVDGKPGRSEIKESSWFRLARGG